MTLVGQSGQSRLRVAEVRLPELERDEPARPAAAVLVAEQTGGDRVRAQARPLDRTRVGNKGRGEAGRTRARVQGRKAIITVEAEAV